MSTEIFTGLEKPRKVEVKLFSKPLTGFSNFLDHNNLESEFSFRWKFGLKGVIYFPFLKPPFQHFMKS